MYPNTKKNNEKTKDPHSALYFLEELDKFTVPPQRDLSKLKVDYENEEFLHIGHVAATVESLGKYLKLFSSYFHFLIDDKTFPVTIQAIEGTPSYDLDTLFFIDDQTTKKPLGTVYDVIGPVASPIYCIRLKNEQEIQEKGIKLNMKVYSAPKSVYTQYVFVSELMK